MTARPETQDLPQRAQQAHRGGRRILLCSPFFHPEPIATGRYNTALARALGARGASVRAVASHPLHPTWRPVAADDAPDGVDVVRGGGRVRYPRSQLGRRVVLELWYAVHVLRRAWRLRGEVDAVVAVFPPNLFAFVLRIALGRQVPVIGIVHDLQSVYFRRRPGSGFVARWAAALEGRSLKRCARLLFLSRSMREWACARLGVPADRADVAYPFVSLDVERGSVPCARIDSLLRASFVHVVYSGALGEKHEADRLVAFFEALAARREDVRCHVFSRGDEFERVRGEWSGCPGARTAFHDLVADDELPALYARSSVQVVPQAPGTGYGSLPSKLPNIVAAGVPAFVICDEGSEAGELAVASGIGCAVHDWSVDVLCERMLGFIDEQAGTTHAQRRERVRGFVERKFSVDRVVDAILGAAG